MIWTPWIQVYGSFLSVLSITTSAVWRSVVTKHLIVVLLAAWGVYVYRDLWPLATFTLEPEDLAEGWILWVKIALLTFAAAIVPIIMPRQYVPFNPMVRTLYLSQPYSKSWLYPLGPIRRTSSRPNSLVVELYSIYLSHTPGYQGLQTTSPYSRWLTTYQWPW